MLATSAERYHHLGVRLTRTQTRRLKLATEVAGYETVSAFTRAALDRAIAEALAELEATAEREAAKPGGDGDGADH